MFSEMLAAIRKNELPDPIILEKRFDFAMTKKLGILKLAPAFWMKDPKINPRVEHLLWASLLLRDRERIEMALSVIAAERQEIKTARNNQGDFDDDEYVQGLLDKLFEQFPGTAVRKQLARELAGVVPDVLKSKVRDMS